MTTDDFDLVDAADRRHRRQPRPGGHRGAAVTSAEPVPGLFTLVLHTHLPWLAHHGRWPVGEEWLYQSWAAAYLPLMRVLRTLAAEDRRHLVTLGMTPVVTAQLDDPYCLAGMHHWLANWQLRALRGRPRCMSRSVARVRGSRARRGRPRARRVRDAVAPRRQPAAARADRRRHDRTARRPAGAPVPAAARTRGCASSRCARAWPTRSQRFAHTPTGIWAPECGYAPGMETDYAAAGVGHFMVDGPSLHGDTALGRPVADSDVVAFGRDLQVSYRVWSPKSGYPGHAAYRDFHTYDHVTGLKPARVTGRNVPSEDKAPYDPRARRPRRRRATSPTSSRRCAAGSRANPSASAGPRMWSPRSTPNCSGTGGTRARCGWSGCCGRCPRPACGRHAVRRDRRRIRRRARRIAAQLLGFGQGLAGVGRRAGRRPGPAERRGRRHRADHRGQGARRRPHRGPPAPRNFVADQILREALLTVSSDWPFMVSKDSAADYARYRAHLHAHATREIAGALASGRREHAAAAGRRLEPRRRPVRRARRAAAAPMTSPASRERACLHATRRETVAFCARSRGMSARR